MGASLDGDISRTIFWVTVTLTYDLVSRISVSGAYLLYYLRLESQIWCMDASLVGDMSRTICGSL